MLVEDPEARMAALLAGLGLVPSGIERWIHDHPLSKEPSVHRGSDLLDLPRTSVFPPSPFLPFEVARALETEALLDDLDIHAVPDATLGGYIAEHDRPPAFEGADAMPYTVSIELERTGSLRTPWSGYLVFPQWADTGLGIVGHVETAVLERGRSEDEVREKLGLLSLGRVKLLLDEAVQRRLDAEDS